MAKTFPTYSEWRKQNGNRGTQEQYQSAKAQYNRYATAMKQESIGNLDLKKALQQKFGTVSNIPFANQQRAAAASAKNSAYNMMGVGYPTAATALTVGKSYIGSQSPIVPQGTSPFVPQGNGLVNLNYQTPTNNSRQPGDLNGGVLPEVVIRPETVSQKWTRITGLPWSEAKKRGFTTGSYEDNIRINKMLDKGYFNQENAVYWDNKQDNAARMHEVMIPAYESGMSPYDYSVQLADQRNNANLPTSWDPEEDYNTVNDYAIGDASMRGNYDEEINNEPTYQINTSPSYNYNNVDNGNKTTYYPYQGIPTQLLYSPQERGENQYAYSVYGYPGTAYGDGSDYPQQFSPAFDAWSAYGNRRYTLAD